MTPTRIKVYVDTKEGTLFRQVRKTGKRWLNRRRILKQPQEVYKKLYI